MSFSVALTFDDHLVSVVGQAVQGALGEYRIVEEVMTAIQQLEIQTEFLSIGFLIILGSVGLGMALAIGLGAKDAVGKRIESWLEHLETQSKADDAEESVKNE